MNINAVIDMLNKEFGTSIDGSYYACIAEWRDWWTGKFKPFHEFREWSGDGETGKLITRELYSMRMGKKVCEDWASILLNEKTEIVVDDEASSLFLQGDDGMGGVLGANDFWQNGNALIERSFATGTGAAVLRVQNMAVTKRGDVVPDAGAHIALEYMDALHIIPITMRRGKVVDVAFVSEVLEHGKHFIYLETHVLEGGRYRICNRYYAEDEGALRPAELPEGMSPEIILPADVPMFALVSPHISNNVETRPVGLGLSVLANAVDQLKGVDLAYNNFNRDFKLGGKKVFLDHSMLQHDRSGRPITPDDVAQQLFVATGDGDLDADGVKKLIQEYNPTLRVAENRDGVQAQLDYLSFKCGFGTKHYQFNGTTVVTATQYTGDKQELVQNAAKHYLSVQRFLQELVRAILWTGKTFLGAAVNPDANVTVNFEDGYVVDKESERERDRQDVRDGLMQPWEYRVKWYGEAEADARAILADRKDDDSLMGFGGIE